ncbi:MAG: hypothetical protein PHG67_12735 [Bacteroidales bacterium]|nr:hypothetical protein [Bacteroidales bacterium]HOI32056.1 hypothetical protein [Bacteroidales bacterium]
MNKSNESISRIRELVLGNNITEIENRFLKLDQQFTYLLDESEKKWKQLYDELDKKTSAELKNVVKEIKTETQQQFDQLKHAIDGNQKTLQNLTASIESIKVEINKINDSQQLIKQDFENRFNIEISGMKKYWTEKLADLQLNKIDRSAMAVLLSELALSLSNQPEEKAE